MQQEIYLTKNGKHFWHCQLLCLKPVSLQIRTGQLNTNWERCTSIQIELMKFNDLQTGVEKMSTMIKDQLRQGFHEIPSSEIVKAYEQADDDPEFIYELKQATQKIQQPLQQQQQFGTKKDQLIRKIEKKQKIRDPALNLPAKPIICLTDDATFGKLVGTWPKFRSRQHLGETLDLGPPGGSQTIPCLLAHNWDETCNPTGYYLSEKLDGMRIIWSGSEMFTRNGNSVNFPTYFVEGWPTTYLDGELWLDRGKFQKLLSIARKKTPDYKAWNDIKYMVFDAPLLDEPFSDRYGKFKKAIEKIKNPHLVYVPHVLCQGIDHLKEELQYAQAIGGEGLMLRDPDSLYEGKRSKSLLKVKTSQDAEGTIIGLIDGTGKFEGHLGALQIQTDNGIEFSVGIGMKLGLRKNPPKIGTRITYRYWGLTDDGKPRFPVFDRLHSDL